MGGTLDWLVADGRIVTLALVLVLVELILVSAWFRSTGRGLPPRALALKLAPGVCLMLALGAALDGAGPAWIVLWLSVAGAAHVLDLWRSWPR